MKEIKAKEGYFLTQADDVGDNRIFAIAIKGANVNEADWREASEDEKVAFEEAQIKNFDDPLEYPEKLYL